MATETSNSRDRLTKDLENYLVYFAHRAENSLSREDAVIISRRVMKNLDIDAPIFGHKGPSWLAREIINNRE
jgi:hypothetical protein